MLLLCTLKDCVVVVMVTVHLGDAWCNGWHVSFLAYHQCYCAGSSLAWDLSLRAVVCGIF